MLDRLPVELVQHIVRLTLPSPSHATYRERQDTLLALCRTSRALRTVAQPALFEVVELASREQVDSFREAVKAKELGERVRSLHLDGKSGIGGARYVDFGPDDFSRLAHSCPHLVELKTHNLNVDLRWLQDFSTLRRLVVSHGSLCAAQPFCLDTLEVFSLSCIQIADEDSAIFNPPGYPSLHALHIQLAHPFYPEPSFGRLLSQIETFSCDAFDLATTFPSLSQQASQPFLLDLSPNRLDEERELDMSQTLAQAVHLRLYAYAGLGAVYFNNPHRPPSVRKEMDRLEGLLDGGSLPSLKLVIFPEAARREAEQTASFWDTPSQLITKCEARRIEVVFEPTPHPYYDSLVSPAFCKRRKATRRE